MFTTHPGNDHLHSRPMVTQNKTMRDDKLWFFMSANGESAQELAYQVRAVDRASHVIGASRTPDARKGSQRAPTTFTKTPP